MQFPQLRGFMRDFGGRGTISIWNFIAGLAEEEKVDGEEVRIRVLGASSLPYPLQSCLKVLFLHGLRATSQRMALPISKLPLSTTESCGLCFLKTSHIVPVPRHYPIQVVPMKF